MPTSRFGVGFLSVFAESDDVAIETLKIGEGEPIRVQVSGPRSYILVERSDRQTSGTRIEVTLNAPLDPGELTNAIRIWCRRVEFPILVEDLGFESIIVAEDPAEFTYVEPATGRPETEFRVQSFPVSKQGIKGEIYVFSTIEAGIERWDRWSWANYTHPTTHPLATRPRLPGHLHCFHGIAVSADRSFNSQPWSQRLDIRHESARTTLSRSGVRPGLSTQRGFGAAIELDDVWESLVERHLADCEIAAGEDGWKYRQELSDLFPPKSYWRKHPEMIRVQRHGEFHLVSVEALEAEPM